jgi:uncharacterized protein (DUF362 family)
MSLTRREFLASAAAAAPGRKAYFGVHPFIEAHPKAVFIQRTQVPHKTAAAAKREAGLQLARQIFVPMASPGVPLDIRVVLKPNVTSVRSHQRPDEENLGTGTDAGFYEGVVMRLKELGLRHFHFTETNLRQAWNYRGFVDINDRHGVAMNDTQSSERDFRTGRGLVWRDVPDPVIFRRIPYHAPAGDSGAWLLNIAKWKAHGMCLTQSVKNEQGLVAAPYVRFCHGWRAVNGVPRFMKENVLPNAEARIRKYFENHRRLGYSRYDLPEDDHHLFPMGQEIWAHKTCDNQSVLKTGLAMIEGIYGRDGDGFHVGDDHLSNLVMFSKDKFRLDIIGLWLGGHEPGNVALYRIAKERGLTDTFNPWDVPIYEWKDGTAIPRKLQDFPRTPLKTGYLCLPGEPRFHLVNEPFDYDKHRL